MTAFGEDETDESASTVKARDYKDATDLVTSTLRMRSGCEGGGKGALVSEEQSLTLATANDQTVFVAETPIVSIKTANTMANGSNISEDGVAYTLDQAQGQAIQFASTVRRLTPVECERLQGFPDNYTDIPWRGKPHAPAGPRYKALGNSMAVPVMRWIGERIQMVDDLLNGAFTAYADQTAEAPDAS